MLHSLALNLGSRRLGLLATLAICLFSSASKAAPFFQPGEVWLDTSSNSIQAHGGGILVQSNTYYWYGEDRTPGTHGSVACYSSTNLYDWKREGVALARAALPETNGMPTFVERPKVIFNARTGKYVMWMHLEQQGYHFASAGIALSDNPLGPFSFLKAIRPITNNINYEANDEHFQDLYGGTFRDMNLFVDDDGKAYTYYASEGNWTMYIVRLNEDYTGPELPAVENKTWSRVLVRKMREAPAPFKFQNHYYLISSACTGWTPNPADYGISENILGLYESKGNPCIGEESELTYGTQSTFVLPAPGHPGSFIFMSDEWHPRQLTDSRYVWLPFTLRPDGTFVLPWHDKWDLTIFDKK